MFYFTRMYKCVLIIFLLSTGNILAQIDPSPANMSFKGYAELYYAYDFNKPIDHNRPSFIYNHDRHNEVNINLGFINASYNSDKVRANFALAAGTYMNANYAAEQGVIKSIYEANAGVKLSRKKYLWIDAGIFTSHLGFENAISADCWTLTRSMAAENSPYYESGVKVSYTTDNNKWYMSGLLLNGWQRIKRPDGNNTISFGTQVTYTPNTSVILNYSTFIGNDKPDDQKQMRYFNNFYGIFHFTKKLHLTAGLDFGMEQTSKGSEYYNTWVSPVVILKVELNDHWSLSARGEYYGDGNEVIISTDTKNGFRTYGFSFNVDYKITNNAIWRIEGRHLNSKDDIFLKDNKAVNTNTLLATSLAVSF